MKNIDLYIEAKTPTGTNLHGNLSELLGADPDSVQIYTGLNDKDDTRIFLGDRILTASDHIGTVCLGTYDTGYHYGFYVKWDLKFPGDELLRQELGFWNKYSQVVSV